MTETTIFRARRVLTMDPQRPAATRIAVREGRILAVGDDDAIADWGPARRDDRFADKVLMPGFVEGHSHLMAGGVWRFTYAGYHGRIAPDGGQWHGLPDIEAVMQRLAQAEAKLSADDVLVAWGFDPIFLAGERLGRRHLDRISAVRPVVVLHSNFHMITVNSAALALAKYDRGSNVEGIGKDPRGEPTGEIRGMAAMFPILRRLGLDFRQLARAESALPPFARTARRVGVTTATDLMNELTPDEVARMRAITGRDDFGLRLYVAMSAHTAPPAEVARQALELRPLSSDKLRVGACKIIVDGSVQAFSAQLRWPGYFKVPDHSVWNMPPEKLDETVDVLNAAGLQVHIHTNGDLATEVALNAVERALDRHARPNHRHTLQHCQIPDRAQFRRMGRLGLCANLFANHVFYFGDVHHDLTMGPDRAQRLASCRTALECGVPLAIHSDAPVTPMGPLFTAWCAVNRRTSSGRLLGARERLTVDEALRAVTLGAAYTLGMDGEIGSIEVGKRADFAVLEDDPTAVGAEALKDVRVWGTVVGGLPFAA
ncbi:MAG: amidohydrolase [Alphaproteobacteria bacterium]|nr:amidohydrolase [Alphaproteobacteria bacterium]